MSWKSYLFPQTVLITSSPYNHHIRVNEEWGKMKLIVNGSPQSGSYIEMLWKKTLTHFSIPKKPIHSALILGLGGGTVLTILSRIFPGIRQTCVDIDKTIIGIAKKYFLVDSIPHLIIVESDAELYVRRIAQEKKKYDVVIIDLSFGRNIPSFVSKKYFLKHIYTLITPRGCLLFNYLREKEYKDKSDVLFQTLQSIFSDVSDFEIANNRFFCCRI